MIKQHCIINKENREGNKNEGTIKTWLFRAREILKEKLEGGFDNE